MAEQSDAAKRAAARKAKILARGNTGLQKLAQTARGDEASTLYGDDSSTSSPRPSSPAAAPSTSAKSSQPSWAPPTSSTSTAQSRSGPAGQAGMTPEQRQMQEQLASMFGSLGGGGGPGMGPGGGQGGMPDLQQLMAQMMGVPPPEGRQNLLGDLDDPAGLGGAPPNPFTDQDFLNSLGAAGGGGPGGPLGGMPGFPGMPGMPGMGMELGMGGGKTKVDKWFPVVHFLSMVVLALFTVFWWEPSVHSARLGRMGELAGVGRTLGRWAGLAGGRGVLRVIKDDLLGGVEGLPIFWAFATLELILQTTRFMVLKSPPQPHSLIANFLPLMPPAIARPVVTGSRYLNLLSQTYKDGALLVLLIGLSISIAPYIVGTASLRS